MTAAAPPQDDLDRIMAVMEAAFDPAFGEAWTRRQLSDALLMPNCHHAIQQGPDGSPGGFTLSRHVLDEEELLLVAVHPDARRQGIGRALLQQLFAAAAGRRATRLFLEMREGNPAENLYRTMGFMPVGRRPNYYRDGRSGRIDAITFARNIGKN
jgi:ribosomal-protein-alanine N-acetyltransferase